MYRLHHKCEILRTDVYWHTISPIWRTVERTAGGKRAKQEHVSSMAGSELTLCEATRIKGKKGASQPICRTKVGALRSERGKRAKRETSVRWQDHSWRIVEQTGTRPDTRPSVADGWAGVEMRVFPLFDSIITDRRTDRRTDKASYRVACPQLKRN